MSLSNFHGRSTHRLSGGPVCFLHGNRCRRSPLGGIAAPGLGAVLFAHGWPQDNRPLFPSAPMLQDLLLPCGYLRVYGKDARPCNMSIMANMCRDGINSALVNRTQRIREAVAKGDDQLKRQLKGWLPIVLPSGSFVGGHRKECLREYNGNVMVDFDSLCTQGVDCVELMETLVQYLSDDSRVYAANVSSSGNGIHLFFRTDNRDAERHVEAWRECSVIATALVRGFLRKAATSAAQGSGDDGAALQNKSRYIAPHEVEADEACKNFNRGCYLSHDPYFSYNPNAEVIHIGDSPSSTTPEWKMSAPTRGKHKQTKNTKPLFPINNSTKNIYDITSSSYSENLGENKELESLFVYVERLRPYYEQAKRRMPELLRGKRHAQKSCKIRF